MLRDKLVEIALQWQSKYGVAPQIISVTKVSQVKIHKRDLT